MADGGKDDSSFSFFFFGGRGGEANVEFKIIVSDMNIRKYLNEKKFKKRCLQYVSFERK